MRRGVSCRWLRFRCLFLIIGCFVIRIISLIPIFFLGIEKDGIYHDKIPGVLGSLVNSQVKKNVYTKSFLDSTLPYLSLFSSIEKEFRVSTFKIQFEVGNSFIVTHTQKKKINFIISLCILSF